MWWTRNEKTIELKRFYVSRRWRRLQLYVLTNLYVLCPDCNTEGKTTLATQVHHCVRISTPDGWRLRMSIYQDDGITPNLIGLCAHHHAKVTQLEQKVKNGQVVTSTKERFNELNDF
jgi:hypothetical protein